MKITQRQLRQIIREELVREGMGDVRISDFEMSQDALSRGKAMLAPAFSDALMYLAESHMTPDGTRRGDPLRVILNYVAPEPVPGVGELSDVITKAARASGRMGGVSGLERTLTSMQPKLNEKFRSVFARELMGLDPKRVQTLRTFYEAWVADAIMCANILILWPASMDVDVQNAISQNLMSKSNILPDDVYAFYSEVENILGGQLSGNSTLQDKLVRSVSELVTFVNDFASKA